MKVKCIVSQSHIKDNSILLVHLNVLLTRQQMTSISDAHEMGNFSKPAGPLQKHNKSGFMKMKIDRVTLQKVFTMLLYQVIYFIYLKVLPRGENREVTKMLKLLQMAYREILTEAANGERTMLLGKKPDVPSNWCSVKTYHTRINRYNWYMRWPYYELLHQFGRSQEFPLETTLVFETSWICYKKFSMLQVANKFGALF